MLFDALRQQMRQIFGCLRSWSASISLSWSASSLGAGPRLDAGHPWIPQQNARWNSFCQHFGYLSWAASCEPIIVSWYIDVPMRKMTATTDGKATQRASEANAKVISHLWFALANVSVWFILPIDVGRCLTCMLTPSYAYDTSMLLMPSHAYILEHVMYIVFILKFCKPLATSSMN